MAPNVEILIGPAAEWLARLPPASFHCCVTSPPYWGLRDYGVEGQLGLEPTPEAYVERLLTVLDVGLRRVLRPEGTLWLNLGDSYAHNPAKGQHKPGDGTSGKHAAVYESGGRASATGIPANMKAKDLVGIPWRVAFAMRERGWYLRAAMPWVKRNCMPSSVRDRPVTAIETVFLFAHPESKGRYFYDTEAVKVLGSGKAAGNKKRPNGRASRTVAAERHIDSFCGERVSKPYLTRSRRDSDFFFDSLSAITGDKAQMLLHADDGEAESGTLAEDHPTPLALVVNPRPFKGAHFAVFPPGLVEPMIKAGTSEHGCCSACGAPWIRETKRNVIEAKDVATGGDPARKDGGSRIKDPSGKGGNVLATRTRATGSWKPSCAHDVYRIPCNVIDPFGGSGTTGLVAKHLGRDAFLIELNPEYEALIRQRINE